MKFGALVLYAAFMILDALDDVCCMVRRYFDGGRFDEDEAWR